MFTLTGAITDAVTRAGIAGARVEVVGGVNAARAAITDGSGSYLLENLMADTFRLHVSATGYDPGEQGVTVPANPRADFQIRQTLPNYAGVWNGQYSLPPSRTSTRRASTCWGPAVPFRIRLVRA